MRCGLFVGGLALNLAEVASVRQQVDSASAVMDTIGALLQERNMGTEELLQQLSEYAGAVVTPGAGGSFVTSLKAAAQNIGTQVEKKITDGQAATQGKLDSLFQSLETANTAANTAKKTAVDNDKSWFECVGVEKGNREKAEAAEQSLAAALGEAGHACQLQQDNKGFKFDATSKYKLDFACDHSVAGNCQAALKTWQETVLQQMFADAEATLAKEEKHYNSLKASCDAKNQARVKAESALKSAESAWSTKRAACKELASQRQASMCDFGTKAQAKCSAEAKYTKLVAATKKAKGDADSEVDREQEWIASGTMKCMIEKSVLKGLTQVVDGADLKACSGQVNFAQAVGKLNTRQAAVDTLSKTNACAAGPITFFNGQTWNVPTGDKPSSKSYTGAKFTPKLDPTSGNFDFCSAPAPAPVPKAASPTKTSLVVSGAGYADANGVYVLDGTYQGKKKWSNDQGCSVLWHDSNWGWGIGCHGHHRYYASGCNGEDPLKCNGKLVVRTESGKGREGWSGKSPVPTIAQARSPKRWVKHSGKNCYEDNGKGATNVLIKDGNGHHCRDGVASLDECKELCLQSPGCEAVVRTQKHCCARKDINLDLCLTDGEYTTYTNE